MTTPSKQWTDTYHQDADGKTCYAKAVPWHIADQIAPDVPKFGDYDRKVRDWLQQQGVIWANLPRAQVVHENQAWLCYLPRD